MTIVLTCLSTACIPWHRTTAEQVKQLVYMYLTHYADQCQDLALLSINSFQKDLYDKNQLVRAMALRVMSAIHVPAIVQLLLMAVKKCETDSSPYVRKTTAHAVPKLYALDQGEEVRTELISVIETLLADKSVMVLGSAMTAFVEVCPERLDLIHPHYRKLCQLLADVEEWGQVTLINVMIRYARQNFVDPFKHARAKAAEKAAAKAERQ